MNSHCQKEDTLIRNLQDSGCAQDVIERFMQGYRVENAFVQMRVLTEQRSVLLAMLHEAQEKLDCLDYLIFRLKKPRVKP